MEDQHVYHHYDNPVQEKVRVKLERNTKGYNYEISTSGETVDEALGLIREAEGKLKAEYGEVK